ncbi:MAG TPA: class I SAM-dependent methyltransferase [Candidatus Pacearchaeota archaeon]|nr:class I SAM-dependent methyltransferase [Candidatus Pacearchaeota archaeon]
MNKNITIAVDPENSNNQNITIFTDQPIKLSCYEKLKWPYLASLPLMWILTLYVMVKKKVYKLLNIPGPSINSLFFDGLGLTCRKVKEYASSWKAMEIIYNHNFPKKMTLRGIVDEFYWHGLNCQALRNRYKLVKHQLRKAISSFDNEQEIRIASLACGSAQVVIEIVAEYKIKNVKIKAVLIDINQEALEAAKEWAKKYEVLDQIEAYRVDINDQDEVLDDFKPHIVEMLGFLDYVDQNEAIRFVKEIKESLTEKGVLITCNINPNPEQYFIKWVINWPMFYREPEDLFDVAEKSGFSDYEIVCEPLKIHNLLIARK